MKWHAELTKNRKYLEMPESIKPALKRKFRFLSPPTSNFLFLFLQGETLPPHPPEVPLATYNIGAKWCSCHHLIMTSRRLPREIENWEKLGVAVGCAGATKWNIIFGEHREKEKECVYVAGEGGVKEKQKVKLLAITADLLFRWRASSSKIDTRMGEGKGGWVHTLSCGG